VKRAALGRSIELEIVEVVIHDLPVVEADLRKLLTVDVNDLVNVTRLAGIFVIHGGVTCITRLWAWNGGNAAQRRLMAVGLAQRDLCVKQ